MSKVLKIGISVFIICFLSFVGFTVEVSAKSVYVKGYYRKDGTYVHSHYRTSPNQTTTDNWSHCGNVNPYTGKIGTEGCNGESSSQHPATQATNPLSTAPSTSSASNGYFTIGSTKEEVLNVMGQPEYQGFFTFQYGYASVSFDTNGYVDGWSTIGGAKLRVNAGNILPDASPFTIGSSKEDVIRAMGTPDSASLTTYEYGISKVYFDYYGKVTGWAMYDKSPLKVTLGKRDSASRGFSAGSTKEEVTGAMGTPDTVSSYSYSYGYSTVYFSNGRVSSFSNIGKNLKLKY